jgi:hypothetical protein
LVSTSNVFGTEKFMFRIKASRAAMALVLAGCSGLPPIDLDPTPVRPTAVTETQVFNEGVKGFAAFENTIVTYTRANMQRSESTATGGGTLARVQGAARSSARIERLDRKLVWILDAKSKRYSECPLKGCVSPMPSRAPEDKSADVDKPREAQCRLKTGSTTITAERTGQKRSINGFNAERYDVNWLVTFRDKASRNATSTLSIELWTTPVTPGLQDAMALEKTYGRAREAVSDTASVTDHSLLLPIEVKRMLSSHLSQYVSPTDRLNFLGGAKKLEKVEGQPILMNVTWRLTGEACAVDETIREFGGKPLFTFRSEVKSYKLEALHDSLFAPPKEYKRAK